MRFDSVTRFVLLESSVAEQRVAQALKRYPLLTKDKVEPLLELDPTDGKGYVVWLARQLHADRIRLPEDADQVKATMAEYDRLKRVGQLPAELRDINRVAEFGSLNQIVAKHEGRHAFSEKLDEAQKAGGIVLAARRGAYEVWKITGPKALVIVSEGAAWCVRHQSTASSYLAFGPLYLVLHNGRRVALLSPSKREAKDVHNAPVDNHSAYDMFDAVKAAGALAGISTDNMGEFQHFADMMSVGDMRGVPTSEMDKATPHAILMWMAQNRGQMPSQAMLDRVSNGPFEKVMGVVASLVNDCGVKPDDLPKSIQGKLVTEFGNSPSYQLVRLAQKTGQRFRFAEKAWSVDAVKRHKLSDQIVSYIVALRDGVSYDDLVDRFVSEESMTSNALTKWVAAGLEPKPWMASFAAKNTDTITAFVFWEKSMNGKPWPDGEDNIGRNPEVYIKYATSTGRRVHTGEMTLLKHATFSTKPIALQYAVDVLKQPWPEAEKAIVKNASLSNLTENRQIFTQYVEMVWEHDGQVGIDRIKKMATPSRGRGSTALLGGAKWLFSQALHTQGHKATHGRKVEGLLEYDDGGTQIVLFRKPLEMREALGGELFKRLGLTWPNSVSADGYYVVFRDHEFVACVRNTNYDHEPGSKLGWVVSQQDIAVSEHHAKDSQGQPLSAAKRVEIFPYFSQIGKKNLYAFAMVHEKIYGHDTARETMSASQVVTAADPVVAYRWLMKHRGKVSSALVQMAISYLRHNFGADTVASRAAGAMANHLVKNCSVPPGKLPVRLVSIIMMNKMNGTGGIHSERAEALADFVTTYGFRIPAGEDALIGRHEVVNYASRLKEKGKTQEAIEVFKKLMDPEGNPSHVVPAVIDAMRFLDVPEPSWLKKMAASRPATAYSYAKHVLKKPWPEAEKVIADAKDIEVAHLYIREFPQESRVLEPVIAMTANDSWYYAKVVIHARFPAGESAIADAAMLMDSPMAVGYARFLRDEIHDQRGLDEFLATVRKKQPLSQNFPHKLQQFCDEAGEGSRLERQRP